MPASETEHFYPLLTTACLQAFAAPAPCSAAALARQLMETPGLPMHCSVHHFIVPATLLTLYHKQQGHGQASLEADLAEAESRAKKVPGGVCGFFGSCGAAVGLGIFFSLATDTSPCSRKTWGWANAATGQALLAFAAHGGPRCCKRAVYLSLESGRQLVLEKLGTDIGAKAIGCTFHKQNPDCLQSACPLYKEDV